MVKTCNLLYTLKFNGNNGNSGNIIENKGFIHINNGNKDGNNVVTSEVIT